MSDSNKIIPSLKLTFKIAIIISSSFVRSIVYFHIIWRLQSSDCVFLAEVQNSQIFHSTVQCSCKNYAFFSFFALVWAFFDSRGQCQYNDLRFRSSLFFSLYFCSYCLCFCLSCFFFIFVFLIFFIRDFIKTLKLKCRFEVKKKFFLLYRCSKASINGAGKFHCHVFLIFLANILISYHKIQGEIFIAWLEYFAFLWDISVSDITWNTFTVFVTWDQEISFQCERIWSNAAWIVFPTNFTRSNTL